MQYSTHSLLPTPPAKKDTMPALPSLQHSKADDLDNPTRFNQRRILELLGVFLAGFFLNEALNLDYTLGQFRSGAETMSSQQSKTTDSVQTLTTNPQPHTSPIITSTSSIQFVFVVGLEGTGHHLMGAIARGSPAVKRLKVLGIVPNMTKPLQKSLFHKEKGGLWNAHCKPKLLNTTQIQQEVVEAMKTIQGIADDGAHNGKKAATISFPVNTVQYNGTSKYGMLSYPNYGGECRKLNYANLDLFYDACDQAQVECRHVYIYRDPYDVLYSTMVNRHYAPTLLAGIHLYTSMLKIIATDLQVHASRGIGCFGLYEQDGTTGRMNWWDPFRILWGWNEDTDSYEEYMAATYKPPTRFENKTEDEAHSFVPKMLDPYMKSFMETHQRVVRLCKENTGVLP
jgi:hypothetical protein